MRICRRLIPIVALALCCVSVWADSNAAGPRIENNLVELRLRATDGAPEALVDKSRAYDHIASTLEADLWRIALEEGTAIEPSHAGAFSWRPGVDDNELVLEWREFGYTDATALSVQATVRLGTFVPEARWSIRVEGLGSLKLASLHFPRFEGLTALEAESLAVPIWMGQVTCRAREMLNPAGGAGGRWQWEYPGTLSMQCVALYGASGHGLSVTTNDTGAHRKLFAVFGDGRGGLGLEVVHVPSAAEARSDYAPPCETISYLFQGDWFTAAERYRDWAREQNWVTHSRIRRDATPQWMLDTGLWVWNRGRSPGVLTPALELQDRAGTPVSVFWHWWHGCAYDAGFPEYLPPREGADAFRQALDDAQARGIHALVYMNQRLWGMETKSWIDEAAERFAVKGIEGRVSPEVYNTFTKSPCASMCMGTPFWRDKYAGLAEQAILELGVDGIYMDQACSSLACYDTTHGHPLGGGAWWVDGFRQLEADIRARAAAGGKTPGLSGEGCCEAWLPYLDAMLSLQVSMERYAAPNQWLPIPFFHAVYHDCGLFYGNYSSLTRPPYDDLWPAEFAPERPLELLDQKFSTQFRLEQARAFVWGQQPTIANFQPSHLEERADEMDYAIRLARVRLRALEYLRDGVMLRPPAIDAPEEEIPVSRLSIYAGQHEAVQEYARTVPLVLASAWRAPDGNVAFVFASIADKETSVRLAMNRTDYPIPESGAIYRITETERTMLDEFHDGLIATGVALAPFDVAVIECRSG